MTHEEKIEELAGKMIKLLKKYKFTHCAALYYNEKANYLSKNKIVENYDIERNFPIGNPKTIILSFDEELYRLFNYGTGRKKFLTEFNDLVEKYGYYHEFGYNYTVSLYTA